MENSPFDWEKMTAEEFAVLDISSIPREERWQIIAGTHPFIKYYSFYGMDENKGTTRFFLKGKQPQGWIAEGWEEESPECNASQESSIPDNPT